MKQTFLKAVFFASILLVATSCNDDDDDNGSTPTPITYSVIGSLTNTLTGETTDYEAIYAEGVLSDEGLIIKMTNGGNDTLHIGVPSPEVGTNEIDIFSPFADDNFYFDISSDTSFYGIINPDAQLTFVVLEHNDTTMEISGILATDLYNSEDENDRYILNADFTDIPYTIEIPDIFGDSEIAMTVDGTPIVFSTVLGFEFFGQLSISGSVGFDAFPTVAISLSADLTPDTYTLGGFSPNTITYSLSDTESYLASTGSLVITSNNGSTITGTFNFTGNEVSGGGQITVTNGSFSVDY